MFPTTAFAAAICNLGTTGRAITRLAAPVGERVDAFLDLPAAPQAQPITINLTLNFIPATEALPWPIN